MAEESTKRTLKVNCGLACLLKDREGILDNYTRIRINCGTAIVSAELNGKISAKGAKINAGDFRVKEIKGELIRLDEGTVIDGRTGGKDGDTPDGPAEFKDRFVVALGDLVVRGTGLKRLGEAEGVIVLGVFYYPESSDMAPLIKIDGKRRAYPDGAFPVLGDHTLEGALAAAPKEAKHIWVSGGIDARDRKGFEEARSRGLTISAASLFTYEGLNAAFGDMVNSANRVLVPDGYEITGTIDAPELPLYGPKVYVKGNFTMGEKDLPALESLEGLIVKGTATLPSSAVKSFKGIGKADKYVIFDGILREINGAEQFSHEQLAVLNQRGEKLNLIVNGSLVFDNDVTAEDVECILSLSYNGTVLVSGAAKGVLIPRVKQANGFMGDSEAFRELTGQSPKDMIEPKQEDDSVSINMGNFFLL